MIKKSVVLCWLFLPFFAFCIPTKFHSIDLTSSSNNTDNIVQINPNLKISLEIKDGITQKSVSQAYVLVHRDSHVFKDHSGFSDEEGHFTFEIHASQNIDITILKKNYCSYSILDAQSSKITVYLEPNIKNVEEITFKGSFTGWPTINNEDDIIDAGVILPFISLDELLDFEFRKMFMESTKGPDGRDIPGNIVLPKQRGNAFYGAYPVQIEHPEFTLKLKKNKNTNLVALMGHFSFKDMFDVFFWGEGIEKMLNSLDFTKLKLIQNFSSDKDTTDSIFIMSRLKKNLDIQFNNIPPNRDIIAISAGNLDHEAREFYPTGFKRIARDEPLKRIILARAPQTDAHNFVVAMAADLPESNEESRKRELSASGMIQREEGTKVFAESMQMSSFFKILKQNVYYGSRLFQFNDVENPGISPKASLAVSHINYIVYLDEKRKSRTLSRLWTLIKPATRNKFTLPQIPQEAQVEMPIPGNTNLDDVLQWEESVFGVLDEKGNNINYSLIDDKVFRKNVSHFSRNSIIYE